jgi:hypothetical protein
MEKLHLLILRHDSLATVETFHFAHVLIVSLRTFPLSFLEIYQSLALPAVSVLSARGDNARGISAADGGGLWRRVCCLVRRHRTQYDHTPG